MTASLSGMTVASYGFLLLFLPATWLLYWRICRTRRGRSLLLLGASLVFYLLAAPTYLPLLLGLSLATYGLGRTSWTGAGVALNVAVLLSAKIWTSGIGAVAGLWPGLSGIEAVPVLLPLGLSFYTFKHVSYLLDVRQGRHPPCRDVEEFLTYSTFFPQITAGPLSHFADTAGQLRNLPRTLDRAALSTGLVHLTFGLAKKVLLADVLASGVSDMLQGAGGGPGAAGLVASWVALAALTLSLYFDFSGYTDIVLGVGILFGVALPANFNSPFRATDPREFWQRWHMSLVTWFRSYVFLAISRALLRRWGGGRRVAIQEMATMATMVLLGIWHGISAGWLLWGAYNGLLLVGHSWFRRRGWTIGSAIVARSLLILSVLFGMALFSSPDLQSFAGLMGGLFGTAGSGLPQALRLFEPQLWVTLAVAAGIALSGVSEAAALPAMRRPALALAVGVLAALCLLQLGTGIEVAYARF